MLMEYKTGWLNQTGFRVGICVGNLVPIQWKGNMS